MNKNNVWLVHLGYDQHLRTSGPRYTGPFVGMGDLKVFNGGRVSHVGRKVGPYRPPKGLKKIYILSWNIPKTLGLFLGQSSLVFSGYHEMPGATDIPLPVACSVINSCNSCGAMLSNFCALDLHQKKSLRSRRYKIIQNL